MKNRSGVRVLLFVLILFAIPFLGCQSDTPLERNTTINPLIGNWVTSFSAAVDSETVVAEMNTRQMDTTILDSVLKSIAFKLESEAFEIETEIRYFSEGSELFKTEHQIFGAYQITDNTILFHADNGLIEEFVFEILNELLYLLFSQYATACQCTTYSGPNYGMPWGMETDKFHGHFNRIQ